MFYKKKKKGNFYKNCVIILQVDFKIFLFYVGKREWGELG